MIYRAKYITPNEQIKWLSVRALSIGVARSLAYSRKPFGWQLLTVEAKHA
jgi:hypothetical protein